jgi:hypothetical protein
VNRRNKAKVKSSKAQGPELVENRAVARPFLKKQSQFPGGQMNATVCFTRTYENNSALRLRENEPDQSQTPGFARKLKARAVD